MHLRRTIVIAVAFTALVAALAGACWQAPGSAAALSGTPVWQLRHYVSRGVDRSFKTDLIVQAAAPPEIVVFGGSRSRRMDPATFRSLTGLRAFNAGLHNGRPEDAWAVTDFLLDRTPSPAPHVVWCLQAGNLIDVPMHPGLIVDGRLSQAFPPELIAARLAWARRQPKQDALGVSRYGANGMLWWNSHDERRRRGVPLSDVLSGYLDAQMMARAGNGRVPRHTRAMEYFEATLKRLNQNGVRPLIIVMPYHPRVLRAFLSVGWGVKQRWLMRYLDRLETREHLKFRVLNCLRIRTFGGSPNGFYDGSHLTAGNSRRLIRYAVRKAPGSFRLWPEWITPAEPAVTVPAYRSVPESGVPGDELE